MSLVIQKNAGEKAEPKVSFVQKVMGGDTYLVMAASSIQLEDEFSSLYFTTQNQSNIFLQPPFDPTVLKNLVQSNNVLNQCVEAMEVNIDGTGHEFVTNDPDGKTDPDATELKTANSFFQEPYPGISFIKQRRKLRREMEAVGYGYLEVLRNPMGDVVAMRNIETHNVRMVKLDTPVMVQKTLMRAGQEIQLTLWVRERRYAQRVALKQLVYYREFGSSRQLNRNNGSWENLDTSNGQALNPVNPADRGTELLLFGVHPDITTPYFLPRWINQLPSVVGSRKAEEQNLEFFDAGGMPPAIIFVQGGTLAKDASDQLRNYLSGKNKNKFRAVVVEAQSSSGSLEAAGSVQVKVERFGAERANDAMYSNYDKTAEEHVRIGFRMPPIFLGKAADYNFATAVTAYMVAEEQVFQPERTEFDETINNTIIKALGLKTLKLKSKPVTLTDAANQLKSMELAKDRVEPESFVDTLNAITGLNLIVSATPIADKITEVLGPDGKPKAVPAAPGAKPAEPNAAPDKAPVEPVGTASASNVTPISAGKKKKTAMEILELASDYAAMKGLTHEPKPSEIRSAALKADVSTLDPDDLQALNEVLATYMFGQSTPDLARIVNRSLHDH
jgi:PBSX family phage portal protein